MSKLFFYVVNLSLLFAAACSLQCGSYTCPSENLCCDDSLLGPVCYDPLDYNCVGGTRLCGENEGACGTICYALESYFCCAGQLMQNGQYCATNAPTTPAPTTSSPTTSAPNNCPAAANAPGINCPAGTTCCGADTISPSCIVDGSDYQCCTWYLSATVCNASDVCGGDLGSGASSLATCGPPGSQFCNYGFAENTFCAADQICCGIQEQIAWCCDAGQTCNTSSYGCNSASSATTAAPNNCPGAAGTAGVNCPAGTTCCGYDSMTPSCIVDGSDYQCCTWYLSATVCNASDVCGGDLGSGASSLATCGPPGSQFCNYGLAENTFCAADQICCGIQEQIAWCCDAGQTCNTSSYGCNSAAPTSSPTTAAPNNCPAAANQPGVNCPAGTTCCGYGSMTPSCLVDGSDYQCCTWYLAAAQCNSTEVCGGDLGPGASSGVLCGPPGSTFCNYGLGSNTFCSADQQCCGLQDQESWCCGASQTCGTTPYACA